MASDISTECRDETGLRRAQPGCGAGRTLNEWQQLNARPVRAQRARNHPQLAHRGQSELQIGARVGAAAGEGVKGRSVLVSALHAWGDVAEPMR